MASLLIKLGMKAAFKASAGTVKVIGNPATLKIASGAGKVAITTGKVVGGIVTGLFAAHFMGL